VSTAPKEKLPDVKMTKNKKKKLKKKARRQQDLLELQRQQLEQLDIESNIAEEDEDAGADSQQQESGDAAASGAAISRPGNHVKQLEGETAETNVNDNAIKENGRNNLTENHKDATSNQHGNFLLLLL
jgi:serine/threonine-protein kinase SRPK1